MWWRIVLAATVVLFLLPASCEPTWRTSKPAKFYRIFGFRGPLEPTQEAVHCLLGILSLPFCLLLAEVFHLRFIGEYALSLFPFLNTPFWSALAAAFVCGLVKETLDVVTSGRWQKQDSLTDLTFWIIGGLVGPLFWVCL